MLFTNPFASLYESHHLQLDWPVSSKEPVPVPIVDDATTAHVLTIAQRPKPQRIARHANTLTSVRLALGIGQYQWHVWANSCTLLGPPVNMWITHHL